MPKKNNAKDKKERSYGRVLLNGDNQKSRFAEAYRTLRTNLHFSFMDRNFKALVVTSAGESEGKTVTAYNLGHALSQTGKSVFLVDADLRKSLLSRIAPLNGDGSAANPSGFTGLLANAFNTPVAEGRLEEIGIHDLFKILAVRRRTGVLRAETPENTVEVIFSQGLPSAVTWENRPEEKKLANVLVKNGVLSEENARIAFRQKADTGHKLGFILSRMGLCRETDLKGTLFIHLTESLRVLMGMQSGAFTFTDRPAGFFQRVQFDIVDLKEVLDQMKNDDEQYPYLNGLIDANIQATHQPGLFLLSSGVIPPNPSELLSSPQVDFLMTLLTRKFDTIIIDTPPILPATDALLLAPRTDGVVLIVKAGHMRRNLVQKCVDQIRLSQANLVGVVLNQVDVRKEGYYNYYNKYYTGYYGKS